MPESLRSAGDRALSERLRKEPMILEALARIEKRELPAPDGVRRKLLSTALRLTRPMAPAVADMMDECTKRLGVGIPIETYVYSSPHFNAACVKPEAGRLFILLSSSLLEAFRGDELKFVLGHELGHYVFGHHDIPIGLLLNGESKPPAELALRLFAWSRYAELSADRAGAACAIAGKASNDTNRADGIAKALFRLASGLRREIVDLPIDDFAAQVDDIRMELEGTRSTQSEQREDWFSTHPFSPLRLKAVKLFLDQGAEDIREEDRPKLEADVATLMALMEPSYLEEQSEAAETLRRLLFAGAIAVADASRGINDQEKAAFEKFFGPNSLSEKLDLEAIKRSVPDRIRDTNQKAPHARRIQLLRDLVLIARADGRVAPKERKVIESVARGLEVPEAMIERTLFAELRPD